MPGNTEIASRRDLQEDIALCSASTISAHLREVVSALHVCMHYNNTPTIKGERHLKSFTHMTHHIPLIENMYEYD